MKNENKIITFLQSFAIFLVVLGHSTPNSDIIDNYTWNMILNKFAYSIHVPLLFLISGFLFEYTYKETSLIEFLNKKLKRLFIPFISLNIIAFIIKNIFFSKFIVQEQAPLLKMFLFPWDGPIPYFWFLYALFLMLFISKLIYPSIRQNIKIIYLLLFITILINIIMPYNKTYDLFCIISFLHYYVFFIIGIIISKYWDNFKQLLSIKIIFPSFILYVFFIVLNFEISYSYLKFFISLFGILISFYVAEKMTNHHKKLLWGIIDGYYYQIYLLHWFGLSLSRCIYKLGYISYNLSFIIIFLTGIILPIIISKLIQIYLPKMKIFIGLKQEK